jgi:hypothetical protein
MSSNDGLIPIDENGRPVGEHHHLAKLTDHEVELIRQLWEDGQEDPAKRLTVRAIAEKFEVSCGTIHDIITFRRRARHPVGWRRVKVVIAGRERVGHLSDARVRKPDGGDADND